MSQNAKKQNPSGIAQQRFPGSSEITDIEWHFDTDDNYIINSTENISSLGTNDRIFLYVEYNFSGTGTYDVNASATGISQSEEISAFLTNSVSISNETNIDVYNLTYYNKTDKTKIFYFETKNIGNDNLTDIEWSLNTGTETINSNNTYNLTPNNFSFNFIEYTYQSSGDFQITAEATSDSYSDSENINIKIIDILVEGLTMLHNASLQSIFFYSITNTLNSPMTDVNWTFDFGDGNATSAEDLFELSPKNQSWVFIEYQYSSADTYTVNATAINGSLTDSEQNTFTIS